VRPALHERDREWLAASPFCLIATSDADGRCDVSPKGDPPGFTRVLDDTTIAIPDRAGNKRFDGFCNILSNPQVGLLFLVPGRDDTLRINGRARLIREAAFFDDMIVRGSRPRLALLVEVEEVFSQGVPACSPVGPADLEPRDPALGGLHREGRAAGHRGNTRGAGTALRPELPGAALPGWLIGRRLIHR
jgi:predicted pyridoxine 5'-phosphate oxidase superfamily flavin-nucleotide-binding protein